MCEKKYFLNFHRKWQTKECCAFLLQTLMNKFRKARLSSILPSCSKPVLCCDILTRSEKFKAGRNCSGYLVHRPVISQTEHILCKISIYISQWRGCYSLQGITYSASLFLNLHFFSLISNLNIPCYNSDQLTMTLS